MKPEPKARALARLVLPAALVGVGAALSLVALGVAAEAVQRVLWEVVPGWFGLDGDERPWILTVLTLVGLLTALIVITVPGHAGPDPATQSLVSPPLPLWVLPGLAIVVVIGLGGGVSLGPENPIIAINVGLVVAFGRRYGGAVSAPQWVGFAAAGTIGALFATPVGAALLLSERPSENPQQSTWDRLFAPLVAAATGSLTMYVLDRPVFAVAVPPYPGPRWADLVSAPLITLVGVAVGLVLLTLFPLAHLLFWRLPPIAMLTIGGFVLGMLGAIGGTVTLFKGLDEMQQLVLDDPSSATLVGIIVVKCVALLVAATCGFRGGKIFPAAFVGVAIGLLAHQVVDGVPLSLAVAAGVLGVLVVVSHSGWLSLFMAATIVGDITLLPILCVALLPAWLLVTDRPAMELEPKHDAAGA